MMPRPTSRSRGVSVLYLAMGFLKWYESPASDKARFAPLLLIPVDLERQTASSRFHLKSREEDIATNLSLQAKLRGEFGVELPEVPEMDEFSPGRTSTPSPPPSRFSPDGRSCGTTWSSGSSRSPST